MNKNIKRKIRNYLIITISAIIYAVGVSLFLDPNNLAPGGVTGISIILNRIIPIQTGTWILLLNIPLLLLGMWKFGWKFTASTLYVIFVVSTALFSDIAFSYDEANEFVRGPLGFSAYIASAFYLVIILFLSVRFFRERYYMEAVIILAIVIVCALATGLEAVWKHVGLLRSASGLSITFFYLYMYAQIFKRDALTGVLNRRCFDLDVAKYQDKITAIISVDLNNLKTINDAQGHAEGDKAIRTTIECIRKSLLRGCVLYRVGGDEFTILCIKRKVSELQSIVGNIRKYMAETPYSCAVGMAERRQEETFEELCARADEEMYENKAEMKRKK